MGGVFANKTWERFHKGIIKERFDCGEIQLLKVGNDECDIGVLYNLIRNKHVYVIQTGFKMENDKKLMPGYVTHVKAVEYNLSKKMNAYDLMHGESVYKKVLCNKKEQMFWYSVQRKCYKFMIEDAAVGLVRFARSLKQ